MFLSLEDLSAYLANGSYEFMSNTRVGYIIDKKEKDTFTQVKKTGTKKLPTTVALKTKNRFSGYNLEGGRKKQNKKITIKKQ